MVPRLRKLFSEFGLVLGSEYLCARAARLLGVRWIHYRFVVQPVEEGVQPVGGGSIRIRAISRENYDINWFPRPAHVIDSRFDQGCLCWVAFKGEQAIGCIWICPGPYLEDEVRCQFLPQPEKICAWDFDVYIDPQFRLGRLFQRLWATANAWLYENGYQWTASRINAFNLSSIRSHERLGATTVGGAVFIVAGRYQLSVATPGGVSFGRTNVPQVQIIAP